jgi:hypothetical protein
VLSREAQYLFYSLWLTQPGLKKKLSQKYKGLFLISKNQNKGQSFNSKSNQQTFLKFNYIHCTKLQQYISYLYYLLSMVKGERKPTDDLGFYRI